MQIRSLLSTARCMTILERLVDFHMSRVETADLFKVIDPSFVPPPLPPFLRMRSAPLFEATSSQAPKLSTEVAFIPIGRLDKISPSWR